MLLIERHMSCPTFQIFRWIFFNRRQRISRSDVSVDCLGIGIIVRNSGKKFCFRKFDRDLDDENAKRPRQFWAGPSNARHPPHSIRSSDQSVRIAIVHGPSTGTNFQPVRFFDGRQPKSGRKSEIMFSRQILAWTNNSLSFWVTQLQILVTYKFSQNVIWSTVVVKWQIIHWLIEHAIKINVNEKGNIAWCISVYFKRVRLFLNRRAFGLWISKQGSSRLRFLTILLISKKLFQDSIQRRRIELRKRLTCTLADIRTK